MSKVVLVGGAQDYLRHLHRLGVTPPPAQPETPKVKTRMECKSEVHAKATDFVNEEFPEMDRKARRKIASDLARRNWKQLRVNG